jgi:hypothetical protein
MNKKVAYSKTMTCTCKPQVRYSAKYLEKVRNAWLNKSRKCNTLLSIYTQHFLTPICFTSLCCTTPCQFTPIFNLCSVIFSLTPSSCLHSITLNSLFMREVSFFIYAYAHFLRNTTRENNVGWLHIITKGNATTTTHCLSARTLMK